MFSYNSFNTFWPSLTQRFLFDAKVAVAAARVTAVVAVIVVVLVHGSLTEHHQKRAVKLVIAVYNIKQVKQASD